MSKGKTRIVFTGDIAFSHFFVDGWKRDCVSQSVKDYLRRCDYVVSDIECPVSDQGFNGGGTLKHVSPPKAAGYLKELGIGAWSIANNHIRDCGSEGVLDTLKVARHNGFEVIGAGADIEESSRTLTTGEDVKVGLLAVTYPLQRVRADVNKPGAFTWDCEKRIKAQIAKLKKSADWVVIIAHGGDEYCDIALPHMRDQYRLFLEWGSDIVVAHHPHVVQNYELFDKKAIFYSLGNFIFDTETQRSFSHTDVGILLGIDFGKDEFTFDSQPVRIDRMSSTVEPCDEPPVFRFFDEDTYKKLWPKAAKAFYPKDRCKRRRQNKRQAMMPGVIFFAHEILSCRKQRNRVIHMGRLLAGLARRRDEALEEVFDYIRN